MAGPQAMTPKQRSVYDFVVKFRAEKGMSPTMQEMSDELSMCKATIHEHLKALVRKGRVTFVPRASRSIEPVGEEVIPRKAVLEVVEAAKGQHARAPDEVLTDVATRINAIQSI